MEWVRADNPSLAVYKRHYQDETFLILNNLSNAPQTVELPVEQRGAYIDLFSAREQKIDLQVTLQPYAFRWLKQKTLPN